MGVRLGVHSVYTEEIAQEILDLIVDEVPLATIGEKAGLPTKATILRWVAGEVAGVPDNFRDRYARAMEMQAVSRFDGLRQIARDGEGDANSINHARLMIDTEKWILARQYRAKYGDRTAVDHGNQPDNPLTASKEAQAVYDGMPEEAKAVVRKALQAQMMEDEG